MLLHTFKTTNQEHGQTLAAVLRTRLTISWTQARNLISQRQVRVNGATTTDPVKRIRGGSRLDVHGHSTVDGRKAPEPRPKSAPNQSPKKTTVLAFPPSVVYVDDSIIIVDKPPGLTTMRHEEEAAEFGERAKKFLPTTLADLLPPLIGIAPRKNAVRPVHRIDRDTSGLVVFARTLKAEEHLNEQFRKHTIERSYLALVRGVAEAGRIESRIVKDRGDGRRGSTDDPTDGQHAVTHVRIVEALGEFTLIECRLETGRTHQVRIHLGERGTPLCGETVYDRPLNGAPIADTSGCPRTFLHAFRLGLQHPETLETMRWESPLPNDLDTVLQRLRSEVPT